METINAMQDVEPTVTIKVETMFAEPYFASSPQSHQLPGKEEPNLTQGVVPSLATKDEPFMAEQEVARDPLGDVDAPSVASTPQSHLSAEGEPNLTQGEKGYPCESCDYRTTVLANLKRHILTHTGEKGYACDSCDYRTSVLPNLRRHILTHTGERPFACGSCEYRATEPSTLKVHMLTHTGERPYVCGSCDYRASRLGKLRRHMMTHTGEKPFACDSCNYRAGELGKLRRHTMRHTGEKPFACDRCDYRARCLSSLRGHMLSHAGVGPAVEIKEEPMAADQDDDPLRLSPTPSASFAGHTCETQVESQADVLVCFQFVEQSPSTSAAVHKKDTRKRKAPPATKAGTNKLHKLNGSEKFLISDLPNAEMERCLLQMEMEDDAPSFVLDEKPSAGDLERHQIELDESGMMSDALNTVIGQELGSVFEVDVEGETANIGVTECPEEVVGIAGHSFVIGTPPTPQSASPMASAEPSRVEWSQEPPQRRPTFPFTGAPGLKITPESNSPQGYFSLLFTEDFFELLVRETNDFAKVLSTENSSAAASRFGGWKEVDVVEMKKFIGLIFLSGIIKISRWTEYWSSDDLINIPIFPCTMSRDRFLRILAALHFASNPHLDVTPSTDVNPIHEITPLLEYFEEAMIKIHEADKILCIDESTTPWWGPRFKPHVPGNSCKYALKLYMLAEPDGLIHRIVLYAGATTQEATGSCHAAQIVNKLTSDYVGSGHSLFMNDFFNSFDLTRDLLSKQIHVTGTLQANRQHNPIDVTAAKLLRGQSIQRWSSEGINVTKWHDRRDVLTVSSEYSGNMKATSSRRGQQLSKPEVVLRFNSMGGVDRCDQYLAPYVTRKRLKWYKNLGFHLMEIMLLNSFILFQRYTGVKTDLYGFRKSVIAHLIASQRVPRHSGEVLHEGYLNPVHFPKQMEGSAKNPNRKMTKRCRLCVKKGLIHKKVSTYCPGCTDHPGLCLECFVQWHREFKGFQTD